MVLIKILLVFQRFITSTKRYTLLHPKVAILECGSVNIVFCMNMKHKVNRREG